MWALPHGPEPSNVIALWPGETPPSLTEALAGLQQRLGEGVELIDELDVAEDSPDAPSQVVWAAAIKLPGLVEPVVCWAQAAAPAASGQLGDPRAEACRWAFGIEAVLGDDPVGEHFHVLRTLCHAFPDVPMVLDVNSTRCFTREELERMFTSDVEPSPHELWAIHAVADMDKGSPAWIHTHGLWRCGLPELEMLEVPQSHLRSAVDVLNTVASLLLESSPPAPGEPLEIGQDLAVALQPWQEVVRFVPPEAHGSMRDRSHDESEHSGVRAVVCAAKPQGTFRKVWVWPREVVEHFNQDGAVRYLSARETARQSAAARAAWPELATAFAAAQKRGLLNPQRLRAVFLVKAGFSADGAADPDAEHREHLWFKIESFKGQAARGELINQPFSIPSMQSGKRYDIPAAIVSDWHVQMQQGIFGSDRIAELWSALDDASRQTTEGGAR